MILVAKGITGGDVLDPDDRANITRVTRIDVFPLVRLDLNEPTDPFPLVRPRIVNRVALGKLAGVDAEENELSDEGIAPQFKGKRTEIAVVVRGNFNRNVRIRVLSFGRFDVEGTGEIVDHRIHKVLDPFVLE